MLFDENRDSVDGRAIVYTFISESLASLILKAVGVVMDDSTEANAEGSLEG